MTGQRGSCLPTATASVLKSSRLSAPARSIMTGHTCVSTSSMKTNSPSSNLANYSVIKTQLGYSSLSYFSIQTARKYRTKQTKSHRHRSPSRLDSFKLNHITIKCFTGVDLGGILLSRAPQIFRRKTRFAGTVIRLGLPTFAAIWG